MDLAKKNYEALNTQLLDELPLLNKKSLKFLQTCITNFACVHKNFYREALDQYSPSVQACTYLERKLGDLYFKSSISHIALHLICNSISSFL